MSKCKFCGKKIEADEEPLLGPRCQKCTEKAGFMVECVWCAHLDIFDTPPCNLDFIIIEDDKCTFYKPPLSSDLVVDVVRKYPSLFFEVN